MQLFLINDREAKDITGKSFCDSYNKNIEVNNWIELNNQLLCSIKYSTALNLNEPISNCHERLLKCIYLLQFKKNCSNPNNKYLILNMGY